MTPATFDKICTMRHDVPVVDRQITEQQTKEKDENVKPTLQSHNTRVCPMLHHVTTGYKGLHTSMYTGARIMALMSRRP